MVTGRLPSRSGKKPLAQGGLKRTSGALGGSIYWSRMRSVVCSRAVPEHPGFAPSVSFLLRCCCRVDAAGAQRWCPWQWVAGRGLVVLVCSRIDKGYNRLKRVLRLQRHGHGFNRSEGDLGRRGLDQTTCIIRAPPSHPNHRYSSSNSSIMQHARSARHAKQSSKISSHAENKFQSCKTKGKG